MPYNIAIPEDANWFYVSDAFAITISGENVNHKPGPFEQSVAINPGESFKVYLKSASYALITKGPVPPGDLNIGLDFTVGLYEINGNPPSAHAYLDDLSFGFPYGQTHGAQVMSNQYHKVNIGYPNPTFFNEVALVSERFWGHETPLILQGTAPSTPGKLYMLGARMFFQTPTAIDGCYQYHVHGAWKLQP